MDIDFSFEQLWANFNQTRFRSDPFRLSIPRIFMHEVVDVDYIDITTQEISDPARLLPQESVVPFGAER